jgi:hypothetical protein
MKDIMRLPTILMVVALIAFGGVLGWLVSSGLYVAPGATHSPHHAPADWIAKFQVPKTIPATLSIGEGLDIGEDVGSAVDFTYKLPFTFTGTIDKVTFDFK